VTVHLLRLGAAHVLGPKVHIQSSVAAVHDSRLAFSQSAVTVANI
jgi:hypothetical protein